MYGKNWKRRFAKAAISTITPYAVNYARRTVDSGINAAGKALRSYAARPSYRDYRLGKQKATTSSKLHKSTTSALKKFKINGAAVQSKSGGFLSSSKFKKTKRLKTAMKGVEATIEYGKDVSSSNQVIWIGHASYCEEDLRFSLWRLVVKKLFAKLGQSVRDISDNLSVYNMTAGDIFQVNYQTTDGAVASVTYTVVAGSLFDDVVNTFFSNAGLQGESVVLKSIVYVPSVNTVGTGQDPSPWRLDLEFAYVTVYCKSSMKIQNRTVNAVGGNEDSVDNVPLYGRSYGGIGNGALYAYKANAGMTKQLIASKSNGYIEGTAADNLKEPWHQMYFQYVTEKGKVHLDPGFIKTSVLSTYRRMSLNQLNRRLSQIAAATKVRDPFGKFRFFGLERMIDTVAEGAASIAVGVEINNYHCLNMYTKFPNIMLPSYARRVLP